MSIGADLTAPAPVESNAATHGRILQLDGLRALAFLSVFLNHAWHIPLLWAGVDVFFVLSGFLITGILLERKRAGKAYFGYFYRRRAFRILPPLALTVILFGVLRGWGYFRPFWLFVLAPNLQALRPNATDLLPLWSLAVEEQFYFVWPFIVLLLSEAQLLGVALAAVVLTPLLRMVCTPLVPNIFWIYTLTPFRADLLCAGAALALLWKRPGLQAGIRRRAWMLCLGGYLLLAGSQVFPLLRLRSDSAAANGLVYFLSLLGAVGLLAWVLSSTGPLRAALQWRPLRFLGEISYTTYLIHVFVLVTLLVNLGWHTWVRLLAFVLIVGYASVSWFLMERPLIRFAARTTR